MAATTTTVSERHIADTGLFVALGQPTNRRFRAVRRTARREGIRFVVPVRVYEELTADTSAETPPEHPRQFASSRWSSRVT